MKLPHKLILTTVALVALGFGWTDFRDHADQRQRRQTLLREADFQPRLERVLQRDPDAVTANDQLALALIAHILDPASRRDHSSPAELQRHFKQQVQQLDRAEQLARETLQQRSSSWRALTAVGASIYLRRSIERDERLIRQYRDWEAPLEKARSLAPDRAEPTRFLTMAYLEVWPMLSAEKQQLTREMLATGLADPNVYRATIEPWLQVSGGGPASLELLPHQAWVYADLRRRFTERGDARLAVEANQRYRETVAAEAEKQLALAQSASSRGDFIGARKIVAAALSSLPIDVGMAQIAASLMRAMPAGPVPQFAAQPFERWQRFDSEQCLRTRCVLDRDAAQRLLPLATVGPERARALLASGDLAAASEQEAHFALTCGEASLPYWLHKSRVLLERADVAAARNALLQCAATDHKHNALLSNRLFESLRPGNSATEASRMFEQGSGIVFSPASRSFSTIELAMPPGDYELDLAPVGSNQEHQLYELLLDGGMVGAVAFGPNARVQTIRIQASGAPQSLQPRLVAGPAGFLQILELRRPR